MAENIIHQLNAQFNDMDLNSEKKNRNENGCQREQQKLPHIEGDPHTAPINAVYNASYEYNPHNSPDEATMEDHDYTFIVTTALLIAQTARINRILDAIEIGFGSA